MRYFQLTEDELLDFTIHVYIGKAKHCANAIKKKFPYLKEMVDPYEYIGNWGIYHTSTYRGETIRIMWLERLKRGNPNSLLTLIHESLHATFSILRDRDMPHHEHSEELYPRVQELIVRKIMKGAGLIKNV